MPTTATDSNLSPADASTQQPYDGAISIDWTPTNVLNPITTVTITLNGTALVVTQSSLAGGAKRCTATGAARAGVVNSVSFVCTTQDANTNTKNWTYTAHKVYGSMELSPDWLVSGLFDCPGRTDFVCPTITDTAADVDWLVRALGLASEGPGLTDYVVMNAADGVLNSVPNLTDYYAVDQEYTNMLPLGTTIGEGGQGLMGLGATINSTDEAYLIPMGVTVTGTDAQALLPLGVTVSTEGKTDLLPLGVTVGTGGQGPLPIGVTVDKTEADMVVDVTVASAAIQDVETEP